MFKKSIYCLIALIICVLLAVPAFTADIHDGYTQAEQITDLEEESDVYHVYFKDIEDRAIYNEKANPTVQIVADFVENWIRAKYEYIDEELVEQSAYGGAIYNYSTTSQRNIIILDSITGNFMRNYVLADTATSGGGALANNGTINSIYDSLFEGNYVGSHPYVYGGAVYNYGHILSVSDTTFKNNYSTGQGGALANLANTAIIDEIKDSTFEGNYVSSVTSERSVGGGAIVNSFNIGTIDNVTFKNNYTVSNNDTISALGGAIYNSYVIDKITDSTFEGNYAISTLDVSQASSAQGGAIYGSSYSNGVINEISNTTFTGNYVYSNYLARGGAIGVAGKYTKILNSSFYNNYAYTESSSSYAGGGAISVNFHSYLDIVADNGTTVFSGNYAHTYGRGDFSDAIFEIVSLNQYAPPTVNFIAMNNGLIDMQDAIRVSSPSSEAEAIYYFTGDGTGTINIHNDMNFITLKTDNTNINYADGTIRTFSGQTYISDKSAKNTIDIDLVAKTADNFVITKDGAGIVTIDEFNILDGSFSDITDPEYKIQILKLENGGNLKIELSDNAKAQIGDHEFDMTSVTSINSKEEVRENTNWNETYKTYSQEVTDVRGKLGVTTTDTEDDSIGVKIISYTTVGDKTVTGDQGDTLKVVNQSDLEEKNFNFDNESNTYTVSEDLGFTRGGTLNVNGVANGDERSVIDFDGHQGFRIETDATVNLKDVEVKNAVAPVMGSVLYLNDENAKASIENVVFTNNKTNRTAGGVIQNIDGTITKIDADFSGNSVVSESTNDNGIYLRGSSIYNADTIGDITGTFKNNYAIAPDNSAGSVMQGGAIYNEGNLGNISGTFEGNYGLGNSSSYGGAIYSNGGELGNITGTFTGNYVTSRDSTGAGGAVYIANGTSGTISGEFRNNHSESTLGTAAGGAVYSSATGVVLSGTFENNYTKSTDAAARGGAANGVRLSLKDAVFTGNYAYSENGSAQGGAFYNSNANHTNISMYGNYAISDTGTALGGAMYLTSTTQIIADDYTSTFQGNYTQVGTGEKDYNAIYMGSTATLTLKAQNNGVINMYDSVSGLDTNNHYILTLNTATSDSVINIYNDILNAPRLSITGSGTVNFNDGVTRTIEAQTLKAVKDVNLNLDLDLANGKADSFKTLDTYTQGASDGFTIDSFNMISDPDNLAEDFSIQIVDTNEAFDTYSVLYLSDDAKAQLEAKEYYLKSDSYEVNDTVNASTEWGDEYNVYDQNYDVHGKLGLTTTKSKDDSIGIVSTTQTDTTKVYNRSMGDTLKLVANDTTNSVKEFYTESATDSYTVTDDVETVNGTLTVSGVQSGNNTSEVDFDGNKGFVVESGNTLKLENVVIKDADSAVNVNSGTFEAKNVTFDGNTATQGSAINTNTDVKITADSGKSEFKNNSNDAIYVSDANATLTLEAKNNGEITLRNSTNGVSGYKTTLTGNSTGTINLYNDLNNSNVETDGAITVNTANGATKEYSMNKLTSDADTKYAIDVDINNQVSDKFITAESSSGTVTINSINFYNGDFDDVTDQSFKVQVLDTTGTIQLALSDDLISDIGDHKIGETTTTTYQALNATTYWTDEYTKQVDDYDVYGTIGLATTTTTNDSLGLTVSRNELTNTQTLSVGDTLKYVNENGSGTERTFETDDENATYTVTDNLGNTAQGTVIVEGKTVVSVDTEGAEVKQQSTLDMNGHNGFVITENDTEVVFKDVTIVNGKDVVTSTNESSKVTLENSTLAKSENPANNNGIKTAGGVDVKGETTIASDITLTSATANVSVKDNADVAVDSEIKGTAAGASFNINDSQVSLNENSKLTDLNVVLDNATVNLSADDKLDGNNLTVNGESTLNLLNNATGTMALNTLNLNSNLNFVPDVDLANKKMDRVTADNVNITNNSVVNVPKLNLITPTTEKNFVIPFADKNLAEHVTYSGNNKVSYSPIYKYNTKYQVVSDEYGDPKGVFAFTRSSSKGGDSYKDFNPSLFTAGVNNGVGAFVAQQEAFHAAFEHSERFMNLPLKDRMAQKNANKYALADNTVASDVGVFSPLMTPTDSAGFWIKPYAIFENVPLRHGPKVSNIAYGTLIGYDSPIETVRHGFDRVFTYYIGYNGASQRYSGIDSYQNGGLAGATMTLYKGNFFNATTISAGANVGDASTMYGHENFTSLLAGIANKTGYNFEFKGGRFIIQPSLILSYSFVNTFDYTNAAGVRIDSDPMSSIQIAPGIKFIGNTKNGWQPYLSVKMVWNILAHSGIKANNVELPNMSIDPYVQYGVGLQRRFGDRFLAYGQAMMQNGGRNGVSLSFGLRWSLGQDGAKARIFGRKSLQSYNPNIRLNCY